MAKKIGVGGLIETIVVFELLCSPAYAHANGGLIETIVVFEYKIIPPFFTKFVD